MPIVLCKIDDKNLGLLNIDAAGVASVIPNALEWLVINNIDAQICDSFDESSDAYEELSDFKTVGLGSVRMLHEHVLGHNHNIPIVENMWTDIVFSDTVPYERGVSLLKFVAKERQLEVAYDAANRAAQRFLADAGYNLVFSV